MRKNGWDKGHGARDNWTAGPQDYRTTDNRTGETMKRGNGEAEKRRDGERENQTYGQIGRLGRSWNVTETERRETEKQRNGEFTHYASRITLHEGGASLGLPAPKD